MVFRVCFWVLVMLWPLAAVAQVEGEEDPAYRAAVELWLSGADDLRALQDFAALARADNLAAQVMLGLIERRKNVHSHVTSGMAPGEWKAIFRVPNTRSGASWMLAAAERSDLAALFTANRDHLARSEAFAEAGVIRDAIEAAKSGAEEAGDLMAIFNAMKHPALPPYTAPRLVGFAEFFQLHPHRSGGLDRAAWTAFRKSLPHERFSVRVLMISPGNGPPMSVITDRPKDMRLRGAALMQHPDLQPLAALAREICPQSPEDVLGIWFYLRRAQEMRLHIWGPLEPLISTEAWRASGRFRGDVLRNMYSKGALLEVIQNASPCFEEAIRAAHEGG